MSRIIFRKPSGLRFSLRGIRPRDIGLEITRGSAGLHKFHDMWIQFISCKGSWKASTIVLSARQQGRPGQIGYIVISIAIYNQSGILIWVLRYPDLDGF